MNVGGFEFINSLGMISTLPTIRDKEFLILIGDKLSHLSTFKNIYIS